jgi:hypothetical protein
LLQAEVQPVRVIGVQGTANKKYITSSQLTTATSTYYNTSIANADRSNQSPLLTAFTDTDCSHVLSALVMRRNTM